MGHSLIAGISESGKTTLAIELCNYYNSIKVPTIVLDPIVDQRWVCSYKTADKEKFLWTAQNNLSCAIFIDESAEMIGHYHNEMFWLATRSRHLGHNVHFISQRVKSISKTVRDQCRHLFLFNSSIDDCIDLSKEFNRAELRNAVDLKQGEYYYCPRWGELEKGVIF